MTGADLIITRTALGISPIQLLRICGLPESTYFWKECSNREIPKEASDMINRLVFFRARVTRELLLGIDLTFKSRRRIIPVLVYKHPDELLDEDLRKRMFGYPASILKSAAFQAKSEILDRWFSMNHSDTAITPVVTAVWFDSKRYNRWLMKNYGLLENAENMPPARKLRHDWALSVVK